MELVEKWAKVVDLHDWCDKVWKNVQIFEVDVEIFFQQNWKKSRLKRQSAHAELHSIEVSASKYHLTWQGEESIY